MATAVTPADHRAHNRNGFAERRNQGNDVEVGHAKEGEADRREQPHDTREHQLRAEPRTDLGHRLTRGRGHRGALRVRDESHEKGKDRFGLDQ